MSRRPPTPFGPLAPRTLLWQLAVLVVAEVLLYRSYGVHDAQFHWATHFLVGLAVASLWRAVFLLVAARPTRFQLLSILGFHLWAMWPDHQPGAADLGDGREDEQQDAAGYGHGRDATAACARAVTEQVARIDAPVLPVSVRARLDEERVHASAANRE